MGYDWGEFNRLMNGEEVEELILADIEEGKALGLHYTPMIFINGRELSVAKGLFAANAVIRAVNAVAATNPPARSAAYDRPPLAAEKYIRDWRDQPVRRLPPASREWLTIDEDRGLKIVVWGDYQEPGCIELDQRIRAATEGRDDVSYVFRHYPMDQECNPVAGRSLHPRACKAAKAVEAAGILGGRAAWWQMHQWLVDHHESVSDEALRAVVESVSWDRDAFIEAMGSAAAAEGIAEDARVAKALGLRSIPFVFVNGKQVPRWRLAGTDIIERIIAEAGSGEAAVE
ncbi:MAG: DsbA family protein [Phycisphaerales bacterium]|nr:MAG: DsbA family protein [Phycisphaerales bacterium]